MTKTHLSVARRIDLGLQQIAIDMTAGKTPLARLQERVKTLFHQFTQAAHCNPRDAVRDPSLNPLMQQVARQLETASQWAGIHLKAIDHEILGNLVLLEKDMLRRNTHYVDIHDRLGKYVDEFCTAHQLKGKPIQKEKRHFYPLVEKEYLYDSLERKSVAGLVARILARLTHLFFAANPNQWRKRRQSF